MTHQQTLPEKPKTVVWAIQLYWAYLSLGIIDVVAWALNQSTANIRFSIIFIFSIYIWLILKISSGRNWARITFLILTLLGAPFSIVEIMDVFNTSKFFIELLFLSLTFSTWILWFMPSSSAWFKEIKVQRKKENKRKIEKELSQLHTQIKTQRN